MEIEVIEEVDAGVDLADMVATGEDFPHITESQVTLQDELARDPQAAMENRQARLKKCKSVAKREKLLKEVELIEAYIRSAEQKKARLSQSSGPLVKKTNGRKPR